MTHGLYRGSTTDVGYDGVWRTDNSSSIVVEIKTTDAYRINLEVIPDYRRSLIYGKREFERFIRLS